MRKLFLVASVYLFASHTPAFAIPSQITYQGTLKLKGAPVDGPVTILFRITNIDGSQVYWSSGNQPVTVTKGLFSTILAPTGINWQNITPYIEVTIEEQLLGPREPITATVFALMSNDVVDGAITPAKLASNLQQGLAPVGSVLTFAGPTPPPGYLLCDGSAVSRNTYATLFNVINTKWGEGDGSSTFNLPDLRGRTLIGAGQGDGLSNRTLGQTLGEESHVLAVSEMPSHSHNVNDPGHSHGLQRDLTDGVNTHSINVHQGVGNAFPLPNPVTDVQTTGITLATTGGGQAHNNMQPSAVLNIIIKY